MDWELFDNLHRLILTPAECRLSISFCCDKLREGNINNDEAIILAEIISSCTYGVNKHDDSFIWLSKEGKTILLSFFKIHNLDIKGAYNA